MPIIFEPELKKNIASGNFSRVYLLFGNDDGLKHLYLGSLIKKTVGDDDCFNLQSFVNDCDLQMVYNAVMQFPMMSELKCVTVGDFDFEGCSADDFERLTTLISEVPDTTVLVLWFDSVQFDDRKSDRFKKLAAACEKVGGVLAKLDHRSTAELAKMLSSAAAKRGSKMETSTARYLIEVCSADYNILKNELDKLTAYAGDKLITKEIVDAVCVKSVEASIYDISKELAARNIGKSINMLDELLFLKVKPLAILSVLSSAFVEMYIARTAIAAGVRPVDAAVDFGYKNRDFVITRAVDNSRRMDARIVGMCLREILKVENTLKSTSVDDRTALEELMVKLVYIMSEGKTID